MCAFIFSTTLSETFLILRRIKTDIIVNIYKFSCKLPAVFVRFQWNLNFLDRLKNTLFKKMYLEGAADGMDRQTDRLDEANSRFSQLSKAPKKRIRPNIIKLLWDKELLFWCCAERLMNTSIAFKFCLYIPFVESGWKTVVEGYFYRICRWSVSGRRCCLSPVKKR